MMKIAVNCGVNHRGGSCDVESSVAVLQIAKGKSQKGTFYFSHCVGLPLVRNKASRRSITTGECHRMECLDHGCEARLWASNMISLLQLKTQALIFTMPSEISWLLALQRCDWCSFCIHLSAGAAALAVGKEDVYSRRRSDGCTVRPSLRRRDSSGHCERLSMGDAFSIDDLRFFERNEDFTIVWKHLPHWTQAATLTFITWRLADSLPAAVISEWQLERDAMLRDLGIDPDSDWKLALKKLSPDRRGRIQWPLFFAWDCRLDEAAGSCLLKTPEFSKIVLDSLLHFEGDRTVLTDAIIMPNHVHLIAAFRSQESMFEQCTSWKHFTATKIRRIQRSRLPTERRVYRTPVAPPTGELSGQFWQPDQFDHLVRSEEQFQFLRDYIRKNPVRAGLGAGEYLHYSRAM